MSHFTNDLYIIHALTNLHVGSGGQQYGVVDNTVQRDVITNYPTIHSSSLKGALREYTTVEYENMKNHVVDVFGSEPTAQDSQPGSYRFHHAQLLTLPMRSNVKPFFRVCSPNSIQEFLDHCIICQLKLSEKLISALTYAISLFENNEKDKTMYSFEYLTNEGYVEDYPIKQAPELDKYKDAITEIRELFGQHMAVASNQTMDEFTENLPVLSRNYLEAGTSKNLWYEEVVPRETRFYTFVSRPMDAINYKVDNHHIQIGANSTIGYGLTHWSLKSSNK